MIKFIIDSTFGISREYAEANDIRVVGLTVSVGKNEYDEGYPDSWDSIYKALASSKTGGKTSQPSPAKYVGAIESVLAADADSEIIIFTIADRLSGTIGSAKIAEAQFVERCKRIAVVNSGEAGPSALMYIRELVDAQKNGADFDELLALSDNLQNRIAMQFIPASLTELARSGRVNVLLSRVGNVLNIKPVFEFARNNLTIYAKTLGFNRAADAAIAHLPEKFDKIMLYYIGDDKYIEQLKDRLNRKFGIGDIEVQPMCLVGGVHIGIGTVGIVTLASE